MAPAAHSISVARLSCRHLHRQWSNIGLDVTEDGQSGQQGAQVPCAQHGVCQVSCCHLRDSIGDVLFFIWCISTLSVRARVCGLPTLLRALCSSPTWPQKLFAKAAAKDSFTCSAAMSGRHSKCIVRQDKGFPFSHFWARFYLLLPILIYLPVLPVPPRPQRRHERLPQYVHRQPTL